MARRMQHRDAQIPHQEFFAVAEQPVELRSVGGEVRPGIEQPAEGILYLDHPRPDTDFTAERVLEIGRGGDVIGMDVGF